MTPNADSFFSLRIVQEVDRPLSHASSASCDLRDQLSYMRRRFCSLDDGDAEHNAVR